VVEGHLHTPAVKIEETIKQILINNAYYIVPNQIDAQKILLVRAMLTLLSTVCRKSCMCSTRTQPRLLTS
jgi:hypothetical protein